MVTFGALFPPAEERQYRREKVMERRGPSPRIAAW